MPRATPALLVLGLLGLGNPARAQGPGPVERIEALYLESAFPEAIAFGEHQIAEGGLSAEDRQEILKYLATIHFAMGEMEEARTRFQDLLRTNPSYRLPQDWPPRVAEFFDEVLRSMPEAQPVRRAPILAVPRGRPPLRTPPAPTPPPVEPRPESSGFPWWTVGISAGAAAVLGVGAYFLFAPTGDSRGNLEVTFLPPSS